MSRKRLLAGGSGAVLLALVFLSLALSARDIRPFLDMDDRQQAERLETIRYRTGGEEAEAALPGVLEDLPSRTPVTVETTIAAQPRESILVKLSFSPARLYLNDRLVYEYGGRDSYPAFLNDPPSGIALLPLPESEEPVALRIELLSPSQRSRLILPELYVGTEAALIGLLVKESGVTFVFSIVLIFLGAATMLVSITFVHRVPSRSPFLWLGLFSFSAGAWVLGECDLSVFLIPYPSLLYALDYLGLFCLTIPFLRFGLVILAPRNREIITSMLALHWGSVIAAILLQLSGTVDLMKSLYWFHVIAPLAFVVFAIVLVLEHVRYRNAAAIRFAPAIILLAASVVLELVNYWTGMIGSPTVLFQFGVLAFILWLGIASGFYVRQTFDTAAEKMRLEYEVDAMGRQISLQQEQYEEMMQNAQTVRMLRHDMRHHIMVVAQLAEQGDINGLREYVEGWEDQLNATREIVYCSNYAVNAVASHYLGLAESEGIEVDAALEIPKNTGCVTAMELCVIVGNLLENGVEACRRMECGRRYLRIRSRVDGDALSIVVSNSFDGEWRELDGAYYSRKTHSGAQRLGVGLPSVNAVCEKYRGLMQVSISEQVWKVSVLVHMSEQ